MRMNARFGISRADFFLAIAVSGNSVSGEKAKKSPPEERFALEALAN